MSGFSWDEERPDYDRPRFRVSSDGVLVLGFADELPAPPEVIVWPEFVWVVPYDPAHRPAAAVPLVRYHRARTPLFNISARRVGGLLFLKVGRLCVSVCITRTYRPL